METVKNMSSRPAASARMLVVFMALAFTAMLMTALTGTFKNPQQRAPESAASGMSGMSGMDPNIVGMLMQRVSKDPNNLDLIIELSEALISAQNWDAAETFAKRATTLSTQDQRPLYLLGVILHNKGQHKEAAEAMKKALAIQPTAPLHYSLGILYTYFLNETQHGLEHFTTALESPDADDELKQAVRKELNKSSPAQDGKAPKPQQPNKKTQPLPREAAKKITELEKAALNNPKDASLWTEIGNLFFDNARPQEAISAYERSLQLAPDNPNVLTDLGIMYRDSGNFSKAIECFTKASSLNPKHENALFNLGVVHYYDLKQKENALRAWNQLLKINPGARAPDGQAVGELIKHLH